MTANILIAEDEPFILESLSFLLRREGHSFTAVQNGAKVLETVRAHDPELIILDAMLPGKDGFTILSELRASAFGRSVPVLVLTAKGQEADRQSMMDLGADAFVTKPFSNTNLLAEIARLLAGKPANEQSADKKSHGT